MSDDGEWGPWIECDGAGGPVVSNGTKVMTRIDSRDRGIVPPAVCNNATWPGYFWRWRRVKTGWFFSEMRRVCDDPAYAAIKAYRIYRPRGVAIVLGLLENLPETAPDGGGEVVPIKSRPRPKPQKVKP
jgi:hypothetical protein